ncbi:probable U3 small nucleolar RNA-associated protein 11 [Camellia sinensis]|uniref:probable U3 small nucleolar RNA-associated protein 11 n=1 Tax=Camellia sinensis TaxID=4442 RepID=UPI001036EC5B|nr:probable U3 small nucleolar RNA-associated protein 11 [Camellia sinensis]
MFFSGFAATSEWKFLICQRQYLNPCVLSLFLKMSSLRNAVYRRAHKERSQPQSRKKYGLLEKHKDYVVRAKAFHKKEDALRKLKEKAAFRNPDEFYFKMIKTKTVDGVHKSESQANKYTQEELMLMKTQDKGYVLQKLQSEKNKIEKLTAVLQSLDNQPSTRHVFYAEDREDAKEMQLRTSKVGKVPVFEDRIKWRMAFFCSLHIFKNIVVLSICRKTAASYRELEARKDRVNDLEKLYMDMAMQKELQKKGRKRKLREDEIVCPTSKPVYKWRPDRKR